MRLVGRLAFGLIIGLTLSMPALAQPIYVANPGESFGPVKVGQPVPWGPRIICISTLGFARVNVYYRDSGLMVAIRLPHQGGYDPTFEDGSYRPVESVTAYTDPLFAVKIAIKMSDERCITIEGQAVTSLTKITAPQAVYVTNKGVQLGMTLEDALAKQGAPACSKSFEGRVTRLDYDGLDLGFGKGQVTTISVSSYRPTQDGCIN